MFRKIAILFIAVIMMFTASCAGQTVQLLDFMDEGAEGVIDCEGRKFTFVSSWYFEWYAFADDASPTVAVEKMMKRFHSIEDKFNAEFEMKKMDESQIPLLLVSGGEIPEMFDTTAVVAYDLTKMDVLASLNNLSAIDLNDKKWGPPKFIQYGNFNGEQYGFYPWHWEFVPQYEGATIFNAELIAKFGGIHPYELKEAGNWNWDSFEKELEKYTVKENDKQYYGALISYDEVAKAAILSNGGQIIDGDHDSGYTFGVSSEEALEALDWLSDLYAAGYLHNGGMGDFSIQQMSPYIIGSSYYGTNFNPNSTAGDEYISMNLSDYGFATFPTGPNGDETDTGAFVYRSRRLNYLSEISDIDSGASAAIADYLFEPLDDSSEEGWKDYVQYQIFSENNNQQCFDTFVYIIENMGYDYSTQMGSSAYEALNSAFERIIEGASASELIESVEDKVMAEFRK